MRLVVWPTPALVAVATDAGAAVGCSAVGREVRTEHGDQHRRDRDHPEPGRRKDRHKVELVTIGSLSHVRLGLSSAGQIG
jgi:hypothetical protein